MAADEWIDKLAEEARLHDGQRLKQEQQRQHEAQVIAGKIQPFWIALEATVERDVHRFQEIFAQDPERSLVLEKRTPAQFRVYRPEFPNTRLEVQLQPSGGGIAFEYETTGPGEPAASRWSGTLFIRVDPEDNLYLSQYGHEFLNLDEVSKMFLQHVLTGVAF